MSRLLRALESVEKLHTDLTTCYDNMAEVLCDMKVGSLDSSAKLGLNG